VPLPIPFKPDRGGVENVCGVREQARLQLASREREVPLHELRECVPGEGLHRLPEPSRRRVPRLEGDAFAREGGREYLFGLGDDRPFGRARVPVFLAFTITRNARRSRR
jgi:uncharacterized protein